MGVRRCSAGETGTSSSEEEVDVLVLRTRPRCIPSGLSQGNQSHQRDWLTALILASSGALRRNSFTQVIVICREQMTRITRSVIPSQTFSLSKSTISKIPLLQNNQHFSILVAQLINLTPVLPLTLLLPSHLPKSFISSIHLLLNPFP